MVPNYEIISYFMKVIHTVKYINFKLNKWDCFFSFFYSFIFINLPSHIIYFLPRKRFLFYQHILIALKHQFSHQHNHIPRHKTKILTKNHKFESNHKNQRHLKIHTSKSLYHQWTPRWQFFILILYPRFASLF